MTYDWQAEFRQHMVRPNRNLDEGGTFSVLCGGSVTITKDGTSYSGNAGYDIDILEIFILRNADPKSTRAITDKSLAPHFAYYISAICDYHGLLHDFVPKQFQYNDYRDAHERIIAYLEAKYANQPRPYIKPAGKPDRIESDFSKTISRPILTFFFYIFLVIWVGSLFMGHPIDGFLILGGFFIAIYFILWIIQKLLSLPTRLALPKRLARFVLLTLGTKATPPAPGAEPPPDPPQQPPPPSTSPGPPPSGTPPLPDGVWLGGLDEEPDPPTPMAPAGPPPSGAPQATGRQPPAQRPAAAEPPEPPLLPVTPMARMDERQAAILREITEVAHLLDSAFNIPIINKSIGIDPLLGTVWGLGDAVSFLPATYIILRSATLGLPSYKLVRMLKNTLIDTGIGLIPIAGQAADFFIKANIANLNIIHEHFGLPPYKRPR